MEVISVSIKSLGPMLMHSCRLANPLDPITKAHKALTGKRKKTDEDQLAIAKSEWMASAYFEDDVGVYIPGVNVESCLFEAAKLRKLGKIAKRAIFVNEDKIKLEYQGPKTLEKLFEDPRFVDARPVKVSTARLIRYRPKFDNWSARFDITFNSEQINRSELIDVMNDAGSLIGLGDFRPRFGKFEVEDVK